MGLRSASTFTIVADGYVFNLQELGQKLKVLGIISFESEIITKDDPSRGGPLHLKIVVKISPVVVDILIHEVSSSGDHECLHKFHGNPLDNFGDSPV